MKKILTTFTLAALLILSACGGKKNAVDADGLQGRYSLDISSAIQAAMENDKSGKFDMASGFASMLLSQLEVTVQFESETAIVDASGIAGEMLKGLADGKVSMPKALGYKIENDSVLYLKEEGKEFEEAGVLKKLGDSYDYLKFYAEKDGKRIEIGLKKIK